MLLQQFFLVVVHRGSPFVRLCLSAVDEEGDSGITARGPTEQEIRQTRRKRKTQGTTETKKAAIGRFLRGSPRLGVVKMYGAADGTRTRDPRRDRPV
ncbi:hypothetical protein, partial [Pseudomonas aeruginosa]|uniref:hypothetical protein n=1 Tax=Pseudomonas aeruginosa TaxID=287 RepID=UPI003004F522